MTSVNDIRSTFLGYFVANGHREVESSNLVPRNDPTLMFTNSGMVQFKNVFTGVEKRGYKRATTSQKCVRAGGKHNDLDNVGYTARHLTFFEMLGNFSFGDYFKSQAIPFAWELLTKGFGIDPKRLTVTVYHDDAEAAMLWKKVAGLPEERIIRIASNDNFWMMGPTGPCGPCSEIFFDHGPSMAGGPPGSPDQDGDRFVEIWNNVFMQFEQFADGRRENLPQQSVDTGMGLERFGAVLQGKQDVFATDTLRALVEASANFTDGEPDGAGKFHHRVIADHMRSTSFLIADGVMPSNEGRGYVLRRIMRRAMRHAHLLGAKDPMMHRLVPTLVAEMGQAFGELGRAQALIAETLLLEETRFLTTLDRGLKLLDAELSELPAGAELAGATAFRLYDTFGFPLDLTQDALREKGRGVDVAAFDTAMAAQKAKARAAWAGTGETSDDRIWFELAEKHGVSEFLGYDTEVAEGQLLALVKDGALAGEAVKGDAVHIVLNQTPFYPESGGQVGDTGVIVTGSGTANVTDTRKKAGVIVHVAEVTDGYLSVGSAAELKVDHGRRTAIRGNHSATHLVNEALRRTLGDHVAQRGSLNAPDRLRFDFSHSKGLTPDQFKAVQAEVNGFIRQDSAVQTRMMTPDDARAIGAQALFGEKYGDEVRVVSMGMLEGSNKGTDKRTYSLELCGGTHVMRTGEIGLCVLLAESAVSSGVRRIEALTGVGALAYVEQQLDLLHAAAGAMRASVTDLPERIAKVMGENRSLNAELADLRRKLAMAGPGKSDVAEPNVINGIMLVSNILHGVSGKDLRGMIDEHKARLGSGVVVMIAVADGKAAVAAGVTDDLTGRVSAVDLVRVAAEAMGGKGGGGRPDMAQGGAPDASRANEAIKAVEGFLAGGLVPPS